MSFKLTITSAPVIGDVDVPVRRVAQAGAQVLYDQAKANVRALGRVTGNLERATYQAFSRDESKDGEVATYHVSWRTGRVKELDDGSPAIKGAKNVAPHGHLVENGYVQRFKMVRLKDGRIRPQVKAGIDPKSLPKGFSKAAKRARAAAYVPLPGGPRHIPGKAPFRRAGDMAGDKALDAMEEALDKALDGL